MLRGPKLTLTTSSLVVNPLPSLYGLPGSRVPVLNASVSAPLNVLRGIVEFGDNLRRLSSEKEAEDRNLAVLLEEIAAPLAGSRNGVKYERIGTRDALVGFSRTRL